MPTIRKHTELPTPLRVGLVGVTSLAALVVGCFVLLPTAASARSVSFVPAFSSGDLGEASSMSAELSISGSEYHGGPAPVSGELVVQLPAGVGGSQAGFAGCTRLMLEASGPTGCPPGSLAGPVGEVSYIVSVEGSRVPETETMQAVFAAPEEVGLSYPYAWFYISGPGIKATLSGRYTEAAAPYGRALSIYVPEIVTVPGEPLVSWTNFTIRLGATRAAEGMPSVRSLTIPETCPATGKFPWAATVPYEESTQQEVQAETACPPARPHEPSPESGSSSAGVTNEPKLVKLSIGSPQGTVPISSAQIANLLGQQLIPSGKAAKIGALLKNGGLTMPFKVREAGTLVVGWYELPAGAKLAKKAKPVLVASGDMTFSTAGTGKLRIRLTAVGKRLLEHVKRLRLEAKGVFTPRGQAPVTADRGLVLEALR
jgi:hypothetical protein